MSQHFDSPWTPVRVARMVELLRSGMSTSLIAEALGVGLTRNAVIGRIHRMGLSNPSRPTTTMPRRSRAVIDDAAAERKRIQNLRALHRRECLGQARPAARTPVLNIPKPESKRLGIGELTASTCRYIEGEEKPWTYCGHRVTSVIIDGIDQPTSSWCHYHKAIVFNSRAA